MIKVQIIGAGGLGRELGAAIQKDPKYELLGYFDDNPELTSRTGITILGRPSDLRGEAVLIGIGTPQIKKKVLDDLVKKQCNYISYIHSLTSLELADTIQIGNGTILCAGTRLTRDISIGSFVLVNLNVTIGHDVTVGDYSSIMPGSHISGSVSIGEEVLIGSGAVILQGIKIGRGAVIGAGAVVTKDVPAGTTVVGIPARIYRKSKRND